MTKLTMKPLVAAAALLGMAFSASAFAAECNACHSNVAKDHAGARTSLDVFQVFLSSGVATC